MSRSFLWRAEPDPPPPDGEISLQLASVVGRFIDGPILGAMDRDHAGELDGEVISGPGLPAFLAGIVAAASLDDEDRADAERMLQALQSHKRIRFEVRR